MNTENYFLGELPASLSKKEQEQLFFLYHTYGDSEAKDKLIVHNLRLVKYTVEKYFKYVEVDPKELNSLGVITLISCVDTFDISKNITFSTYAAKCISNAIITFIKNQNRRNEREISINTKVNDNEDDKTTISDTILDDTINIEQAYEDQEEIRLVRDLLLSSLSEKEYLIISLRFGFNNNRPHTLNEISKILNCTKQNTHAAINKILNKLKHMLQEKQSLKINKKNTL